MASTVAWVIKGGLLKAAHEHRATWLFSDEIDRCADDALGDSDSSVDHFEHVVDAYSHAIGAAFDKHNLEEEQPQWTGTPVV